MLVEKINILVVEDNLPDAKLMEIYLKDAYGSDFFLTLVVRLQDAIEVTRKTKFDVIILDLTLPDSTGISTFEKMYKETPEIPIVVLTGLSDEVFGLDAVKMGAEDFLSKNTINTHIIKRAINYSVERHKLRKTLGETSQSLVENERKLKEAQKIANIGNWEWDIEKDTMEWSEELYYIYGIEYKSVEITPDWLWRHIAPEDVEKAKLFFESCKKNENPEGVYFRIIRPDLKSRVLYTIAETIQDDKGEIIKIQGVSQDVSERLFQEKKYASLLEAAPDAIITVGENFEILSWNPKASEIFGWKEKEILRANFIDLIIAGKQKEYDRISFRDAFKIDAGGQIYKQLELIAKRKDNTIFPAELTVSFFKVDSKPAFICFLRDVTQRKRIENEVKEKEELYRTVVESLSEGLILTDVNDRIIFTNEAMETLTGYTIREMEGKIASSFFMIPGWARESHGFKLGKISAQSESFDVEVLKKWGGRFVARVTASPYKNSRDEIVGTVTAVTDITSLKREEELEELVLAATKSYNSLIITDKDGKIEWINEGFSKLFGYNLDEVKDRNAEFLCVPKAAKDGLKRPDYFKKVASEKKPLVYETRKFSKEGNKYWVISTLTPVFGEDGDVSRIIAIDSNISVRKGFEEQLKVSKRLAEHSMHRANKAMENMARAKSEVERTIQAKEMFMANMSHEIRTPMNGILGLTDLLLNTDLNSEQLEYLKAIKSSGDTLLVVINDVLDVSKIEAGKMTFEKVPFNLRSIVDTVYELFLPKIEEKQIQFIKKVEGNVPEVLIGDPARLNQIIMNLVSNAVKFTGRGEVVVSVSLKANREDDVDLEIKVADTGRGIPEDKMNTIFQNYTQVTPEIARKYGGTGLGLAITKRLVELQGGKIAVSSKYKTGSEFIVTLNYQKCKDKDARCIHPVSVEKKKRRDLKGVKILLAEDNPVNQMLAVKVLSDWGSVVEVAENGKEVIEMLQKNPTYDIILMDIKMPEMDGYQTTEYIREKLQEPLKSIPIVAQTAHAATWEAEKCLKAGMNDYLSKPLILDQLFEKISRFTKGGNNETHSLSKDKEKKGEQIMRNNNGSMLDLSYLEDIAQGNSEFMTKVIDSYIQSSEKELKKLKEAGANSNWDEVYSIAHKIKSSANYIGLKKGVEVILKIENAAINKTETESIAANIEALEDIIKRSVNELEGYKNQSMVIG